MSLAGASKFHPRNPNHMRDLEASLRESQRRLLGLQLVGGIFFAVSFGILAFHYLAQ